MRRSPRYRRRPISPCSQPHHKTIPALIGELGAKGTRAAVVITAGIRGDLKQAMLDAARPYTLRVQGPNCVGLMLPRLGLNASFSFAAPAGDIAFLSQSGALITGIVDWARGRNIGFSHVISLGDMADVDFGDLLDYLAADPASRAILLYMEAVTNAPKFMSAARRAARSKPVVVVKAGRSASGAKAAQSHTGALAGSDLAYEAAFRRAGVLRVKELDDLFSAAEMLSRHPRLSGDRLAILSNGGGAGVMAADCLQDLDGNLAQLTEATLQGLEGVSAAHMVARQSGGHYWRCRRRALPARARDPARCRGSRRHTGDELPHGAHLEHQHCARPSSGSSNSIARGGRAPKPMFATWLGDAASREARAEFAAHQIASFATPSEAIDGFMQLVRHARAKQALMRTPPSHPGESRVRRRACQGHHRRGTQSQAVVVIGNRSQRAARRLRHTGGADRNRAEPGRCRPACQTPGIAKAKRAWSRFSPMTSRISPTSAGCGWGCGPQDAEGAAQEMLKPSPPSCRKPASPASRFSQ